MTCAVRRPLGFAGFSGSETAILQAALKLVFRFMDRRRRAAAALVAAASYKIAKIAREHIKEFRIYPARHPRLMSKYSSNLGASPRFAASAGGLGDISILLFHASVSLL